MNSNTFRLPIGLFAFRFLMLFAIPVSIMSAEAMNWLSGKIRNVLFKKLLQVLIIVSILYTSGYPKYWINTCSWSWGVTWTSMRELNVYVWLRKNLKPNTKVFSFSDNLLVLGHDMFADFWSNEYKSAFKNSFNKEIVELYHALKYNHFEYIIIGQREVKKFGLELVDDKIQSLHKSDFFEYVGGIKKGAFIFRVR